MKFRHLLFANLMRKKARTLLTLGSFAVALFLFGVLVLIRGAFNSVKDVAGADRLIVTPKIAIIQPLPISYRERIARIPGVRYLTSMLVSPAYYQDNRIPIPSLGLGLENQREVYPEFIIPDEQWKAFAADREGIIVGERLAQRLQWKIGDRIPLKLAMGVTEFNVRGIYRGSRPEHDTTVLWYHRQHFEDSFLGMRGLAGWYVLRVTDPKIAPQVAKAIDQEFANSAIETKTSTEKELATSLVGMMGNFEFLIRTVGAVVLFTLLLVTGNTMAIAVRERTGELAVLKAVGFSDAFVLWLVMAESMAVAALGGGFGLAAAKLFSLNGDPTKGLLKSFYLPTGDIGFGFALALAVGVGSALVPALSAMRLRVATALRRV